MAIRSVGRRRYSSSTSSLQGVGLEAAVHDPLTEALWSSDGFMIHLPADLRAVAASLEADGAL